MTVVSEPPAAPPTAGAASRAVVNRLRRAHGQLGAVIAALETDADCRDVVTQLAAVRGALDRAGFVLVAAAMRRCLDTVPHDNPTDDDPEPVSLEELEKLFLMLS